MPHAGGLDERIIRAGYEFNYPLRVHKHPNPASVENLFSAFKLTGNSSPSLVIDTVKRGEDDEDVSVGDFPPKKGRHVILRVFDSLGGLSRGTIQFGNVKVKKAWKVNVLEDEWGEMKIGKEGLDVEVRAFEVVSYKLLID
jgi:alpha-mannosidase